MNRKITRHILHFGAGGWSVGEGCHWERIGTCDVNGPAQAEQTFPQHNHSFHFKGLWGGEMRQDREGKKM